MRGRSVWPGVGLIHFVVQCALWLPRFLPFFPHGWRLAVEASWWPELLGFPLMTVAFGQFEGLTCRWIDSLCGFNAVLIVAVMLCFIAANSFIWVVAIRMISRWVLNLSASR